MKIPSQDHEMIQLKTFDILKTFYFLSWYLISTCTFIITFSSCYDNAVTVNMHKLTYALY